MLNNSELEEMQDEQEANMPETVYIQRIADVDNGSGGTSQAVQTTATTKGRIGAVGRDAQEREIAGRLGVVQVYVITLPIGSVVAENDQLQINGRQFFVGGVVRKSNVTAQRVVCSEVR
jgi:hypothetical protein